MPRATRRPTSLLLSCGCLSRYVRVPSEPPDVLFAPYAPQISRTPLGFELSAPFAFSHTTRSLCFNVKGGNVR